MSGGSMDYISYRIEEYSADLCDHELTDLAKDMAEVYHDAEWWHSGAIWRTPRMAHTGRCADGHSGGQVTTMDGQTHDIGRWDMIIAFPPCTKTSNAGDGGGGQ